MILFLNFTIKTCINSYLTSFIFVSLSDIRYKHIPNIYFVFCRCEICLIMSHYLNNARIILSPVIDDHKQAI